MRPELTTEGKRQTAVKNVTCIWNLAFSGGPTFAERVQQVDRYLALAWTLSSVS